MKVLNVYTVHYTLGLVVMIYSDTCGSMQLENAKLAQQAVSLEMTQNVSMQHLGLINSRNLLKYKCVRFVLIQSLASTPWIRHGRIGIHIGRLLEWMAVNFEWTLHFLFQRFGA